MEARKQRIVAQCERNATLSRLTSSLKRLETEKLSANQLVPVFGVSVDKMLALTSQTPGINIVNVSMPSAEERAEMRALDRKLDAFAAMLKR